MSSSEAHAAATSGRTFGADFRKEIESVAIGVSEPGADLTVTVAGRASQLQAGQTSLVVEHGGPVSAGGALRLSLQSTGARGITVAVRVREAV